jgi:tRNA uridine 5-carboxymethylaminomethyl modification enzyme
LISDEAWSNFEAKQKRMEEMKQLLERARLTPSMAEQIERSSTPAADPMQGSQARASAIGQPLAQLLKRPEMTVEQLAPALRGLLPVFFERDSSVPSASSVGSNLEPKLSSEVRNELKSIETEIKYAGYLDQQQRAIDRLKKSEQRHIPAWFDYHSVSGLSREMQEKLRKVQPQTIGQASRIPGVTPAAVSLVNVYIEIQARQRDQAAAL